MDSSAILNSNVAMANYIPVISMVIAILAVIVGPLISSRIAKRQTILPMRQAWIESLRELIADYLTDATYINSRLRINVGEEDPEFERRLYNMSKNKHSIELMLNSNEQTHIELSNKLNKILDTITDLNRASADIWAEFVRNRNEIYSISRKILKSEWNRIKNWTD